MKTVRLGEHQLSTDTDGPHEDIRVIRIDAHPNFEFRNKVDDTAVLTLERDVTFTNRIRPICLPKSEPNRSKTKFTGKPSIAGWGHLQEGGRQADILQTVRIPLVNNFLCKMMCSRLIDVKENQFGDHVICAGKILGGKDSCQGDSGGPLMLPIEENGQSPVYQIGVVSYGIGCAKSLERFH